MVGGVFSQHHGSGDRDILSVPRKAHTDILSRSWYYNYWQICISGDFCKFYFCGTYDSHNDLPAGDRAYKGKSFYYRTTSGISACPIGMAVPLFGYGCGVVDISCY